MTRPDKLVYFMYMAHVASIANTCPRRRVGCVLVDEHLRIMSTGFNGVAAGQPHCIDSPCSGVGKASTEGLDLCEAIHAEQNAIAYCKEVYDIKYAFCTSSPCVSCCKLLLGTGCRTIFYHHLYQEAAQKLWLSAGRDWIQVPVDEFERALAIHLFDMQTPSRHGIDRLKVQGVVLPGSRI